MRATDFAGELMHDFLAARIVPLEPIMAGEKIDIFFVEDGCPLEESA